MKKRLVFLSYSRRDSKAIERLLVHLKPLERENLLDCWDESKINPGEETDHALAAAIAKARVAILALSADYFASDYIVHNHLPPLLDSAASEGTRIFYFFAKPCAKVPKQISRYEGINTRDQSYLKLPELEQELLVMRISELVEQALESGAEPDAMFDASSSMAAVHRAVRDIEQTRLIRMEELSKKEPGRLGPARTGQAPPADATRLSSRPTFVTVLTPAQTAPMPPSQVTANTAASDTIAASAQSGTKVSEFHGAPPLDELAAGRRKRDIQMAVFGACAVLMIVGAAFVGGRYGGCRGAPPLIRDAGIDGRMGPKDLATFTMPVDFGALLLQDASVVDAGGADLGVLPSDAFLFRDLASRDMAQGRGLYLRIISHPPGAAISVDGDPNGHSRRPFAEIFLKRPSYPVIVELALDGYETAQEPVERDDPFEWKDGQRLRVVEATLTKLPMPPPPPREEPRPVSVPGTGDGFLRVNSKPSTKIAVDGRDTGLWTPQVHHRLNPGVHRIQLSNPEKGISETFTVEILSGETTTAIKDLRATSGEE